MSLGGLSSVVGLAAFFIIGILFKLLVGSSGRKQMRENEAYFNMERDANFSRAREIPEELYYRASPDALPVREYPQTDAYRKLIAAQERAVTKANNTMLRLNPPMKNIEIKQAFGAANLERITNYEENYDQYIRALCAWAEELIRHENYDDAKKLLDICMDMNSLIFLPYSLLCNIYELQKDKNSLATLRKKVTDSELLSGNDILSKKINDCIESKLSII